ncbi:hypothetical protein Vadar_009351 [Vaccinium darrowii]|uniref:Uncharacterized protein n=1 Tax=Vaccinium darrowii TaxID=229202 RepID=A0ACB7YCS5_9ERIC|nr:hypothetical protein Vadar_009351 [Vaccinium darrowii]
MDTLTLTASSEPEMFALRRLSEDFGSIFTSNSNSFSDAKIAVAGGREFAVHRYILSARSPFFKSLFSGDETRVKLEMKDLAKDFQVRYDALDAVLVYLYSGIVRSLRPEGVCFCVDDDCEHIACRPALDFVVEVLYASFIFEIPELVDLCQRHLLDVLDKIAADDILVVLSLANVCGNDLRMMSSYLESRVALAKLLFPAEAKVAMVIARVHDTSEFALPMVNSTSMAGSKRKTEDLDDVPFKIRDEHLNRIKALFKTVELGKLFFPRCSEVLDDMVDNDLTELVFMPNETQEERQLKKQRYTELKEDITRAFREDKEEINRLIHVPSSSSSTSIRGVGRPNAPLNLDLISPSPHSLLMLPLLRLPCDPSLFTRCCSVTFLDRVVGCGWPSGPNGLGCFSSFLGGWWRWWWWSMGSGGGRG